MKASATNLFKVYYGLTKPGIIYGNALTAIAGFLLAANGHISWGLFGATLIGLSLVIASACVFNNYLDQDIDRKMARTRKRALPSGLISTRAAIIYASVLGFLGFTVLISFTNKLASLVAFVGFFIYIVVYGFFKRRSVWGTAVGSVAGAVPPVVGYTAVTDHLDASAVILFLILICWQMPHFYAIAIYRLKDYAAAGLPVWPVKKGIKNTKLQILVYVTAFFITAVMLSLFSATGIIYLIVAAGLGVYWLWLGAQGFSASNSARWARKMFGASLIVITLLSVIISLSAWLP